MDHCLKQDVTEREGLGEYWTQVWETGNGETDSAANANRGSWSTSFSRLSPCKYSTVAGEKGRRGRARVKLEAISVGSRNH